MGAGRGGRRGWERDGRRERARGLGSIRPGRARCPRYPRLAGLRGLIAAAHRAAGCSCCRVAPIALLFLSLFLSFPLSLPFPGLLVTGRTDLSLSPLPLSPPSPLSVSPLPVSQDSSNAPFPLPQTFHSFHPRGCPPPAPPVLSWGNLTSVPGSGAGQLRGSRAGPVLPWLPVPGAGGCPGHPCLTNLQPSFAWRNFPCVLPFPGEL